MDNPYTITFGRQPKQLISRLSIKKEIIQQFSQKEPSVQTYMISGVRGSGKTVLLTDVGMDLMKNKNWIVVELNPERDMLKALAAHLASESTLAEIFKNAHINLSFFGMGLEVSSPPITDIEVALEKMIASLKRKNKRLLIEIDEVTNTKNVREFIAAFQIFLRRNLPVFLLMTGLYDHIYELQNEKTLTFLYRSPKIELGPLNMSAIAANYEKIFQLPKDKAIQMAAFTNGYSFAFQVLGFLTYQKGGDYLSVIPLYKQYLEEYVYEKVWSELSVKDQQVCLAMASIKSNKISEIRAQLNMSTNQFNPYRARLIRKGVADGHQRGYLRFTLPLFNEFVLEQNALNQIYES